MITIKNVKIAEFMSEETLCFSATVYEDGKRIGTASNDGHGGSTFIRLDNPRDWSMSAETELENTVDDLVYAFHNEKETAKIQKKLERDCVKGICVGEINHAMASYYREGFKGMSLIEVAKRPDGIVAIQKMVDRIKTELKSGESILNTNLESMGVRV